jgi:flagellin-like hook-associated protein FlgL
MIDMTTHTLNRVADLNKENQRISYQMSSGRVLKNGSDNAILYNKVLDIKKDIRIYDGLKLQIDKTRATNTVSDNGLDDVKKSLDKIKVDILKALNAGIRKDSRHALAVNIEGIRENMYTIMNSRVNDEYLFSGSDTQKRTLIKDDDFKKTGKISYGGDSVLRRIVVEPDTYRRRGVTAFDSIMYNADKASTGEKLKFVETERIIDDENKEWVLSKATAGNKLTFDKKDVIIDDTGAKWKFIDWDNADGDNDITTGIDRDRIYKNTNELETAYTTMKTTVDTANTTFDAINNPTASDVVRKHDAIMVAQKTFLDDTKNAPHIGVEHLGGEKYQTVQIRNDKTPIKGSLTPDLKSLAIDIDRSDAIESDELYLRAFDKNGILIKEDTNIEKIKIKETNSVQEPAVKEVPGEDFMFYTKNAIVDTDGNKWKLKNDTTIVKLNIDGSETTDTLAIEKINDGGSNGNDKYKIKKEGIYKDIRVGTNHIKSYEMTEAIEEGSSRVLEAKHNYFDDLNVMINALKGYSTNVDGTKGYQLGLTNNADESDRIGAINEVLRVNLTQTNAQFTDANIGHAELGGRNRIFNLASERIEAKRTHYAILLQETNGADMAKLAMETKTLEMTYQALYATITKMNSLSILNYMK